jgi:hypothetical protein
MKVIVLVVHMFLFGEVEEEATFVFQTMEECMREKETKEGELLGFPVERVEAVCELQDKQTEPPPVECMPLVPLVSCIEEN